MTAFRIDDEYELKLSIENNIWDTYQFGKLLPKAANRLFKYYSLNLYSIDSLFRT